MQLEDFVGGDHRQRHYSRLYGGSGRHRCVVTWFREKVAQREEAKARNKSQRTCPL